MITLQPVNSSQIAAVGYDAPTETLAIEFAKAKAGVHYEYTPVPFGMYEGLLAAESIGKFFGAHIKGKEGIRFTKVEPQKVAA